MRRASPSKRRWPWVVLGTGLALGTFAAVAPSLFGNMLVSRLGGPQGLEVSGISGPLWSPKLSQLALKRDGLDVQAGEVGVRVNRLNPLTKTVHLSVNLRDAVTSLHLQDLLKGEGGGQNTGGGGAGWRVVIDQLDVQRSEVQLDGEGMSIPSLQVNLQSNQDGVLFAQGQTPDGPFEAQVRLEGQRATVDLDADARIAHYYWNGIQEGRLKGRYTLGDGPIQGDLQLSGGKIRVQEAEFVEIQDIVGQIQQRGEQIKAELSGQAWQGPVKAQATVDLGAQRWEASAQAQPTAAGLGQALGTQGKGALDLQVQASGWADVKVDAQLSGAQGQFAGIPYRGLRAEYAFLRPKDWPHGQLPTLNQVSWQADTALGGTQRLQGQWAFQRGGQASWKGGFAGKPLAVSAQVDAENQVKLSGQALGGPLAAQLALKGMRLRGTLNPDYGGAKARVQLSGTPKDLAAQITGTAGPFPLRGQAKLDQRGLRAELDGLHLDLDRSFKGSWTAERWSGAGVSLSGQGEIDLPKVALSGELEARLPGVDQPLRGPLTVDALKQEGVFTAGAQRLSWKGQSFSAQLRDLLAQGAKLNGDLKLLTGRSEAGRSGLRAFGKLDWRGKGLNLSAQAQGEQFRLSGQAGGVELQGLSQLQAPYRSRLTLKGTAVSGELSLDDGLRFALTTQGAGGQRDTARGLLKGTYLDASGRMHLAAFQALWPSLKAQGTLDLNFAGLGGQARLNAELGPAAVSGVLTRQGASAQEFGSVQAQLKAHLEGGEPISPEPISPEPISPEPISAELSGAVYPAVELRGPLRARGQTVQAQLQGPYDALRARVWGRTQPLTVQGVTFPAQELDLGGSITPQLQLKGQWGGLKLGFDARSGQVRVEGRQSLTAYGQPALFDGSANWGTNFSGALDAQASFTEGPWKGYQVQLKGPWRQAQVQLRSPLGLHGNGTLNIPETRYAVQVQGPLALPGQAQPLAVQGRVSGQGAEPHGEFELHDPQGGSGRLSLAGLKTAAFTAHRLQVAGYALEGELRAHGQALEGHMQAGPWRLTAENGQVRAWGELAGHQVQASGQLQWPDQLSKVQAQLDGPYLMGQLSGDLKALQGQVQLKAQRFGSAQGGLSLPAQRFPLKISVQPQLKLDLAGLQFQGGRWAGQLQAQYAVQAAGASRAGQLVLKGEGKTLQAQPKGPLSGQVQVYPQLQGQLSAELRPWAGLLPAQVREQARLGQLIAQVQPGGVQLSLKDTLYQRQPLQLQARLGWQKKISLVGQLRHPQGLIPVQYDGQDLRIQNARLDAALLSPLLPGAEGELKLNAEVPRLDLKRATGLAQVELRSQSVQAEGSLRLQRGQWLADLQGKAADASVRVRGPLYPQAQAGLDWQTPQGSGHGQLSGQAEGRMQLQLSGELQGRPLSLSAQGQRLSAEGGTLDLQADLAGALLQLKAQHQGSSLLDWPLQGHLHVPELHPLAGTSGQVSALISGQIGHWKAQSSGQVAGITFQAPWQYQRGTLRLNGAEVQAAQGRAQLSGSVWPKLELSAQAQVKAGLPGDFSAQLGGTFQRPELNLKGTLAQQPQGLQVAGTQVQAHLLGQDWNAQLQGSALSGTLRGNLKAGELGGLLHSDLYLKTAWRSDGTQLKLSGRNRWDRRAGWGGQLEVSGQMAAEPLSAVLRGQGELKVQATLGQGAQAAHLDGQLSPQFPVQPQARLELRRWDLGALWGKPQELRASGQLELGGGWKRPQGSFEGRLDDRLQELSGRVQGRYQAGDLSFKLEGPKVNAQGSLRSGRYAAELRAQVFQGARLLPDAWGLKALSLRGRVQARGSLSTGPEQLQLENLDLRGEQAQAGPFSLAGTLNYQPSERGRLDAELYGSLRGGLLRVSGSLDQAGQGQGLSLRAEDIAAQQGDQTPLGRGRLDAQVQLSGPLENPQLSGEVRADTDQLDLLTTLGGRVQSPRAGVRLSLRGARQGLLYADLSRPDWRAGTVQAKVSGTVRQSGQQVSLDLAGQWPRLRGQVQAQLGALKAPLLLQGDGSGQYRLETGQTALGSLRLDGGQGWLPKLQGALDFDALRLWPQASGQARVKASLGGTLGAPQLSGSLQVERAGLGGLLIPEAAGSFRLDGRGLEGQLMQAGQVVATLKPQGVQLQNLSAEALGSTLQASGQVSSQGEADLKILALGALQGELSARYAREQLQLQGQLRAQGLQTDLDLKADPRQGWKGQARLSGGPSLGSSNGVLSQPLNLQVGGPWVRPLVTGEGGLLGAGARLVASQQGAELILLNGPSASASGRLSIKPDAQGQWQWTGDAELKNPDLALRVRPNGPLADPKVVLSVQRGEWQVSGTASRRASELTVTDGQASGKLRWNGQDLQAELPALDLARLDLKDWRGTVSAQGELKGASGANPDGAVQFKVQGLKTPWTIPFAGVKLEGDLDGRLELEQGRPSVVLRSALSSGIINAQLQQSPKGSSSAGRWQGQISGSLQRVGSQGEGTLDFDLDANEIGLVGAASATAYPAVIAGQDVALDGSLEFAGQTVDASLSAQHREGRATLEAQGGIANLLPGASRVLNLKPTEGGYDVRAQLRDMDLGYFKLLPDLSGPVNAEANLSEGGGSFFLQAAKLKLGSQNLPARFEGTKVGRNWRWRGYLDKSTFTAGLDDSGEVFGQATLQALPLGAMVAAVTGRAPGDGLVTGTARFRFPVNDPPAGTATVVAERIRVSAKGENGAPDETLLGSGTLDLADREVRNVNVQLSGAGTWDVRGQYTRQKVDLRAQFRGTTFTPVLKLIPALSGLNPALKGSLNLSAAGTYERPQGLLLAQDLEGQVAGLSLKIPNLSGELPDSGAFSASAQLLTGGSVGSEGQLDLTGQLTLGKLSDTRLNFKGLLSPEALGPLPNTQLSLYQQDQRWLLSGSSTSASVLSNGLGNAKPQIGTLQLWGSLSPAWDLRVRASQYNLPIKAIYTKSSALDGEVRLQQDGQQFKVSGNAQFNALLLGRVNAPALLPAPGVAQSTEAGDQPTFDSLLPEELRTFPKPQAPDAPKASRPFLERLILDDLKVTAPNGIRVDEKLARAEFGTSGLKVSGSGAKPKLDGKILAQRGSIFLRENEFQITGGQVEFGGQSVYPTFDITARGTVPSRSTQQRVPIVLQFKGDYRTVAGRPNVLHLVTNLSCGENSSDCVSPSTGSAYNEAELYALVATGVPDLNRLPSNISALGASALQTALNVFVLSEVERTLARALGVSVVRLTPILSTEQDGNISAAVTVGSYLTRDLFVQYQVDLRGEGLFDATYTTDDGRFTFKVSTPLLGLDFSTMRPSFSVAYNVNPFTSLSLGAQTNKNSNTFKFTVTNRFGR